MALRGAIVVDTERCKGCGVCVVNCPTQTIALSKEVNSKGYNFLYMENLKTVPVVLTARQCVQTQ